MALNFSSTSQKPILHGCKLFKRLWDSLSCMTANFSNIPATAYYPAWLCTSSISGTACPAWLWQLILHGCELFKHPWDSLPWMSVSVSNVFGVEYPVCLCAIQASLGQPILHGRGLFKHLWGSLSCMAVSFSSIISGTACPAWLWNFSSISQKPILHGCKLFNHLWESISCMAANFPSIFGTEYPVCASRISTILKHLWDILSCMAVSLSSIFGTTYPGWQNLSSISQKPILHGCEHLWDRLR